MSEHRFGVEKRAYSAKDAERIDAIAAEHGCTHVRVDLPGDGPKAWFACRDYGEPFNRHTRDDVRRAMEAAGFWRPEE